MTVTFVETLQKELDDANPTTLADALRQVRLGTLLTPLKRVFTGLTAAAAFDLTAIDGTGEVVGAGNPNRLPALITHTLRVTASGTAASLGTYIAGDAGATPIIPPGGASAAVGVATISDDGKTLTFPNTITGFVVEYIPRAAVAMSSAFAGT